MFHSKKVYTWYTAGQNFFDSLIDPHQNIGHLKDSYSGLLRGFISRDHKPCRLKWTNDPEETTGYNSMNQSWGGNILDMACLWMIFLSKTNKKYDLNRHCVNICQRGSSEIIQNSISSYKKVHPISSWTFFPPIISEQNPFHTISVMLGKSTRNWNHLINLNKSMGPSSVTENRHFWNQ